jgi:hypothetical protein
MHHFQWSLVLQHQLDKMVNVFLSHLDVIQKENTNILTPVGCLFPVFQLEAIHVTDWFNLWLHLVTVTGSIRCSEKGRFIF